MAVFAGGSAAIKKAHIAKATSDLHNFQIAVEMTLNETPLVANIATETKKAQLESIMDALNDNLAADYKLTAVDGTLTGNITKTAATTDDASFIICQSDKTDSWGNPYFVIIDRAERGGSFASEFYMTAVTAGPNAILHLDGAIDGDDVFSLTSYADGDVISATYNMAEAAPTIVGGSEAATTYTSAMTAPVNNGVTVGEYVAPENSSPEPVPASYSISASVANGTYSGNTSIVEAGNATITIVPNDGYALPETVTVTGATSSYNAETGVISLNNPTGNVNVVVTCEEVSDLVGIYYSNNNISFPSIPITTVINGTLMRDIDGVIANDGHVLTDGPIMQFERGDTVTISVSAGPQCEVRNGTATISINGEVVASQTVAAGDTDAYVSYTFTITEDVNLAVYFPARF